MSDGRRYIFEPLQRPTVVASFSAGSLVIGGVGLALAFVAAYAIRNIAGLLLAGAILFATLWAALLPVAGRTLDQWAPVLVGWAVRRRKGFRLTSPTAGVLGSSRGAELSYETSLPPQLVGLRLLSVPYGREKVGVFYDTRRHFLTGVIAAQAGQFGLRDASEQERKLAAFGGVLASEAREQTPVRRLQWLERTKPSDGDELAGYFQSRRDRRASLEESRVHSYIELLEAATPTTQEHEVLIALQIDTRKSWRQMNRMGGGIDAATRVLLDEMNELAKRLAHAEVRVLGALRPRQLARFVRDSFDPYGRGARSRLAVVEPGRDGVEPALAGPMADEVHWGHYRSDSAFHLSFWVAEWPRTPVAASFLTPLLMQTKVLRTVSVIFEPRPPTLALREAESAQTAELSEETARRRRGFISTARNRQQQQAVSRREQELADGHAEVRFSGFITISAPDPDELDQRRSELEFEAQRSRLVLQPMYGEHEIGFTFSLPLCRGLR
jgi:hypothetical protein